MTYAQGLDDYDSENYWLDYGACLRGPVVSFQNDLGTGFPLKPPGSSIPMPKMLLNEHPIVGFDAPSPKPHRPGRAPFHALMAWMSLAGAIFTRIEILEEDGRMPRPLMLTLDGPAVLIPDFALVWNWRPRHATAFVMALVECGLSSEELGAALVGRMGRERDKRPPIPKLTRTAILAKTGGLCVYCGVRLTTKRDQPNSYHVDHLLAVRDGATDDPALLVPACADCNQKKGAKTLAEFISGRGA